MTETIRFALIGREDLNIGTGSFEVTLADGRRVMMTQINLADLINPLTESIEGDDFGLYDLGFVSIGNTRQGTTAPLDVADEDTHTNSVALVALLAKTTTGTPAAGIGTAIRLQSESGDENPSNVLEVQGVFTDVTAGSEDSDFRVLLRAAGAALAEKLRLTSDGILVLGTLGTPSGKGLLELNSTTLGFLPPRMTTAQRDAIASPGNGLVIYNTSTSRLNVYDSGSSTWLVLDVASAAVGVDEISGLALSNNGSDATNDIDIAVGLAASDDAAYADRVQMSLTSALTKQLDATWAAGTNQGGRFSGAGAIANGTWHVFLIKDPTTGTVDVGFDTSATGANAPAAYTKKRRIGSILRESAAIVAFTQYGDEFYRNTAVLDVDVTDPGTAAVTRTLSVPTGVKMLAIFNVVSNISTANLIYLSSLDVTDSAPSVTAAPLGVTGSAGVGLLMRVWTNTSAQIRSRLGSTGGGETLRIATLGWLDRRGRG